MISATVLSCAPKLVTPTIQHKSFTELKEREPDCTGEIHALEQSEDITDELVLAALFCYRKTWKHWENAYRTVDAQIGAINGPR